MVVVKILEVESEIIMPLSKEFEVVILRLIND